MHVDGRRLVQSAGALLVAAALAACSMGGNVVAPAGGTTGPATPQGRSGLRPAAIASSQPLVYGIAIQPVSVTVAGTVGTFALSGTTQCSGGTSADPCPNVSPLPAWTPSASELLTFAAVTLPLNGCPVPAGAPSGHCYIVGYENGVGPYLIQGPGGVPLNSSGILAFGVEPRTMLFDAGSSYEFFVTYVTGVATPPPPTPTPVPTPTPTPTPAPTATPTPVTTPTPCTTATPDDGEWGDRHDDGRRFDRHGHHHDVSSCCGGEGDSRGDVRRLDDGGGCCSSDVPRHHHHREGERRGRMDDGGDCRDSRGR